MLGRKCQIRVDRGKNIEIRACSTSWIMRIPRCPRKKYSLAYKYFTTRIWFVV